MYMLNAQKCANEAEDILSAALPSKRVTPLPVRHDLQELLLQYLDLADPQRTDKDVPLFRTLGRGNRLTHNPLSGIDICRMVKRRLVTAGLPSRISPHSFRSCAATDLLLQGVPLEDVQFLLGHSDVRVTRLYDLERVGIDYETPKGTRHDPANRRECCKECNGDLESLRLELLIAKYPRSPLQAEWKERLSQL